MYNSRIFFEKQNIFFWNTKIIIHRFSTVFFFRLEKNNLKERLKFPEHEQAQVLSVNVLAFRAKRERNFRVRTDVI